MNNCFWSLCKKLLLPKTSDSLTLGVGGSEATLQSLLKEQPHQNWCPNASQILGVCMCCKSFRSMSLTCANELLQGVIRKDYYSLIILNLRQMRHGAKKYERVEVLVLYSYLKLWPWYYKKSNLWVRQCTYTASFHTFSKLCLINEISLFF